MPRDIVQGWAGSGIGMLSIRKPPVGTIRRVLAHQEGLNFTYLAVGATSTTPPAGFDVDRTRIELGSGEFVFLAAKAAIQRWEQFRLGWVEAWSPDTALKPGQVVAILGWAVGFWWLNACRIIYTVDDAGPVVRFGFAYGTLPGHVESGEERFLVEWDRQTDKVCYDILAFSRPNHLLTRLGYPLVRRRQLRFARDSAASMIRAVHSSTPRPAKQ